MKRLKNIKQRFFNIEDFFTPEINQEILELEAAENFLFSLVGENWREKLLIKEIKPPFWTLKILSPIFSRTLSMNLYSTANQKLFFKRYNYQAKFKFEADPILLGKIREAKTRETVKLPNLPTKEETKQILTEYLSLECQEQQKMKSKKIRKKYSHSQAIIHDFLINEPKINQT